MVTIVCKTCNQIMDYVEGEKVDVLYSICCKENEKIEEKIEKKIG